MRGSWAISVFDGGPEPERSGQWYDAQAGPLVRLYAVARGRARPSAPVFDLIALIRARTRPQDAPTLGPEQAAMLDLCRDRAQSVAELAAGCDLPLGVARVILSDLHDLGHILVHEPMSATTALSEGLFEEVLNGLRAL
jgi:Protein of unknown function (DUF742)